MPLVSVGSSGMDSRKKWACIAISATVFSSPGAPFTPTLPSRNSRSPGLAFQHMARDAEQLFPDDASGADKRARDHYRVAAAPGASAGETVVGVGIGDADVGGINL